MLGNSNANFEGTFGLDPSTGAIDCVNDCLGDTYDVAPINDLLYAVPITTTAPRSTSSVTPTRACGGRRRVVTRNYGETITTKNDVYGWDYRGYKYAKMLHWWPDLAFGSYTSASQAAWAVDTVAATTSSWAASSRASTAPTSRA